MYVVWEEFSAKSMKIHLRLYDYFTLCTGYDLLFDKYLGNVIPLVFSKDGFSEACPRVRVPHSTAAGSL